MMATIRTPISRRTRIPDHVDDVVVGTEFPEMEKALLRDDASDQKCDQYDDRYRLPRHAIELIDCRCQPESRRLRDGAECSGANRPEHIQKQKQTLPSGNNGRADGRETGKGEARFLAAAETLTRLLYSREQSAVASGKSDDRQLASLRLHLSRQARQLPSAESIESGDTAHVDGRSWTLIGVGQKGANQAVKLIRIRRRPKVRRDHLGR